MYIRTIDSNPTTIIYLSLPRPCGVRVQLSLLLKRAISIQIRAEVLMTYTGKVLPLRNLHLNLHKISKIFSYWCFVKILKKFGV